MAKVCDSCGQRIDNDSSTSCPSCGAPVPESSATHGATTASNSSCNVEDETRADKVAVASDAAGQSSPSHQNAGTCAPNGAALDDPCPRSSPWKSVGLACGVVLLISVLVAAGILAFVINSYKQANNAELKSTSITSSQDKNGATSTSSSSTVLTANGDGTETVSISRVSGTDSSSTTLVTITPEPKTSTQAVKAFAEALNSENSAKCWALLTNKSRTELSRSLAEKLAESGTEVSDGPTDEKTIYSMMCDPDNEMAQLFWKGFKESTSKTFADSPKFSVRKKANANTELVAIQGKQTKSVLIFKVLKENGKWRVGLQESVGVK